MNKYIEEKKDEFIKAIQFFTKEISSLRTGRANPNLLDGIEVEAYGVNTPISGVASITIPDGHSILLAPWDKNIIKDVEKAVVKADLGVGVTNEGGQIRLVIPKMTEENRKELVKKLNEKHEASRVTIRKTRDEIKQQIEKAEKDKEITEDEKFKYIKELDDEVGKRNDELKAIKDKKESDVMTI